jgi:hypothetical protein
VVPREEEQARKEFEREKAQFLKERSHYEAVLLKVTDQGGDTTELQQRLVDVDDAITGVEAREANVRAGYIDVISNIGAFGPDVVKIGSPDDSTHTTGSASSVTRPCPSAATPTP